MTLAFEAFIREQQERERKIKQLEDEAVKQKAEFKKEYSELQELYWESLDKERETEKNFYSATEFSPKNSIG